jgi:hypothetical protein
MAAFNPFGDNKAVVPNNSSAKENLLISFTPAKFDVLIKVLGLFDKSTDSIKIQNSNIVQKYGPAIVSADVTTLFDDQSIDFEIVQPKKYIKLFKLFKNNTNIDVIEDNANNRYIITNGEIKLFLPKQAVAATEDTLLPDFEDCSLMFDVKIDKEASKQLMTEEGEMNYARSFALNLDEARRNEESNSFDVHEAPIQNWYDATGKRHPIAENYSTKAGAFWVALAGRSQILGFNQLKPVLREIAKDDDDLIDLYDVIEQNKEQLIAGAEEEIEPDIEENLEGQVEFDALDGSITSLLRGDEQWEEL